MDVDEGLEQNLKSNLAEYLACVFLRHLSICDKYQNHICFDSIRPRQQFFSTVWTGLPGLNQS